MIGVRRHLFEQRILGFTPPGFVRQRHSATLSRLPGTNATAIARNSRDLRNNDFLSVTAFFQLMYSAQFRSQLSDDPTDTRIGKIHVQDPFGHDAGPFKRSDFSTQVADGPRQFRSGIESQLNPLREKKTAGRRSNKPSLRRW